MLDQLILLIAYESNFYDVFLNKSLWYTVNCRSQHTVGLYVREFQIDDFKLHPEQPQFCEFEEPTVI